MTHFDSPIDLGIPETPVGVADPALHGQFLLIYNALRKLQEAISDIPSTPGPEPGPVEPPLAEETDSSFVPYYIPPDETFTVPVNKQALFEMNMIVDGDIVIDGYLIEVD